MARSCLRALLSQFVFPEYQDRQDSVEHKHADDSQEPVLQVCVAFHYDAGICFRRGETRGIETLRQCLIPVSQHSWRTRFGKKHCGAHERQHDERQSGDFLFALQKFESPNERAASDCQFLFQNGLISVFVSPFESGREDYGFRIVISVFHGCGGILREYRKKRDLSKSLSRRPLESPYH